MSESCAEAAAGGSSCLLIDTPPRSERQQPDWATSPPPLRQRARLADDTLHVPMDSPASVGDDDDNLDAEVAGFTANGLHLEGGALDRGRGHRLSAGESSTTLGRHTGQHDIASCRSYSTLPPSILDVLDAGRSFSLSPRIDIQEGGGVAIEIDSNSRTVHSNASRRFRYRRHSPETLISPRLK